MFRFVPEFGFKEKSKKMKVSVSEPRHFVYNCMKKYN